MPFLRSNKRVKQRNYEQADCSTNREIKKPQKDQVLLKIKRQDHENILGHITGTGYI